MIHENDIKILNKKYRNSEHPLVSSGATIIEKHEIYEDAHFNKIDKETLYIEECSHLLEPKGNYFRLDDPGIVIGKNTACKSTNFLHLTYGHEIVNEDSDEIVWDSHNHNYILDKNAAYCELLDHHYHEEDVKWSDFHDSYIHEEDAMWSEQVEDYYHHDYSTEFEEYHNLNNSRSNEEVINDYHESPAPSFINKDIYTSGWFVGFEVEKSKLDNGSSDEGDDVDPCRFFAGWETDSSCGVEGISNIYNIKDPQLITDIKNASHIDSPTDISCGGHINISYKASDYSDNFLIDDAGINKQVNSQMLKKYMGIIYAMFPQRLVRSYCNSNKKIERFSGIKYSPIRDCSNRIEIRLFNRVANAQTLVNRVKFLHAFLGAVEKLEVQLNKDELLANTRRFPCPVIQKEIKDYQEDLYDSIISVDFAYNPHMRYAKYILNACYPVLKEIYGSSVRLSYLIAHTYAFTDYILTDKKSNRLIQEFIDDNSEGEFYTNQN